VVTPSAGEVVLVPFPFSDLSQSKVRPAVCLADVDAGNLTYDPPADEGRIWEALTFLAGVDLIANMSGSYLYGPPEFRRVLFRSGHLPNQRLQLPAAAVCWFVSVSAPASRRVLQWL